MAREYDAGATTAELRLKYGLAQGSLLKLLRANGAVIRRQGLTAAQENGAVGLYASGLSIGSIAEQFGASYTTVRNCLLRANIEMRGTHDWHDAPAATSELSRAVALVGFVFKTLLLCHVVLKKENESAGEFVDIDFGTNKRLHDDVPMAFVGSFTHKQLRDLGLRRWDKGVVRKCGVMSANALPAC